MLLSSFMLSLLNYVLYLNFLFMILICIISKEKALYYHHICAMHGSVYSLQLRPLSKEESWGHLPISFPKGIAAWYGRSWCYGRKCVVIYFCQVPRSHRWKISFWVVWTGPSAGGGWCWAGIKWLRRTTVGTSGPVRGMCSTHGSESPAVHPTSRW